MPRVTDYGLIPPHMMESLLRYRDQHCPVGDFLKAVISNDLTEAVQRADDTNVWIIPVYVSWLYNEAPGGSWGNDQAYTDWIADFNKKEQ